MTGEFRFLLDEHIHIGVVDMLDQLGFDAIHVHDIGMLGGTDNQIYKQAIKDQRIVVTRDVRDFIKLAKHCIRQGEDSPVLLLVPSSFTEQHPGPLARAIQTWTIQYGTADRVTGGISWLVPETHRDDGDSFVRESEPAWIRALRRLEATA